ncbi:MAG: TonB-dependent receptor [Sinobacteraceae bacterium]|nr:TonB-dependent receptor [Nevskiaceae bacterium]MCP5339238.1 TonB-dependent receptor [Nevskiaceae bacterium]MCP5359413.1 TonB-dependent receptor [Nevskiaceae bacterium]MCP5467316.1 TonB-dependent receptor [Nevskiaceae bacterium]MCP5470852.1 TonB-dependent receptor [Nevskiaceae bacterium]
MRAVRPAHFIASTVVIALGGDVMPVCAQEGESVEPLQEIYVTARKRDEALFDIPVAISAFTEEDLVKAGAKNLDDVASLTPGFQFFNQGNQVPGRYNTQLQFRGLTTAQFSPSFATGALFIDGIYVLNGGTSISLMDLERVEVIKGPQAAYFGRNTFGGAVNLITRDPDLQAYSGRAELSLTGRQNTDMSGFVEGPIVEDRLSFSLSGRIYDKRGQWSATDGGRLGDEETRTVNGVLLWQPLESLSVKLRYAYSEDRDGPAAQGFISGIINDNCTGLTIDTVEGPRQPRRYVCGRVPDARSARVFTGNIISSNTVIPTKVIAAGQTNPATLLAGVPHVDEVGMKRETERFSLAASYDIGDYNLAFTAARNEQAANWIRDYDMTDRVSFFSRDPQLMDDESYELRLTSPQGGRFRWLVGANYYTQEFTSAGGGGDTTISCASTSPTFTDDPATCTGQVLLNPNNLAQNADRAKVMGYFAAFDFDILESLTLSVEGRQQSDELTKGAGLITPGSPLLRESFDDFLPRAILRWQPVRDTNLYLSYSEGQIAGDFNTFFINANAQERAQYVAQDARLAESLPAETLEAWEIGWKQRLLDNRLHISLALFHNTWKNIKGRSAFAINETCRAADIASGAIGCSAALGQAVGSPRRIAGGAGGLVPLFLTRSVLLPGDATIKGLELESGFSVTHDLSVQANLAYIDSAYDDYMFNFVEPIAGFSQMKGRQTPRQPKWSGNVSATQNFRVLGVDSFVRLDVSYQGKAYADESNLAYMSDYTLVNLRAGFEKGRYRIEAFVRNLTDEDEWMTGARFSDFSSPFQAALLAAKQGIAVSPLDKRDFGIRINVSF